MKKSKLLRFSALALAGVMTFAGCGGASTSKDVKVDESKFKTTVKNEGTPVKNANPITIGIMHPEPVKGQLNPIFYLDAVDWDVMKFTMCGAMPSDEFLALKQDDDSALVKFHVDKEQNKLIFTIHKDAKWSNGEDFVADDIIATYHLMGNPKFEDNIRYDETFEAILGMKDYHEGKADTISGIKKVDNKTVEISVDKVTVSMLWADGIVTEFLNAGQIAKITDFTKFWEEELNTKPLSYGPYYLEKNNGGESFLFKANPYYYKGEAKNKELKIVTVPTAQIAEKLKTGEIDYCEVSSTIYPDIKDINNGDILGEDMLYMGYIGFKLGKFDKNEGKVVSDPNAKLADVNLRRAIAMSIDNDTINEKLFNGIGTTPTGSGLWPPVTAVHNKDAKGIKYDVEGAKKLLEENGYKDVDGDGFRENKDGSKLELRIAIRNTGNKIDEPLSQEYLKSFKNIGLNVKLTDDKLIGIKDWSQRVQADDPSIDMFVGAWGLGTNPDPTQLISASSSINYYRYQSEALNKALENLKTEDAFDREKLKKMYVTIDETIANDLPWVPVRWTKNLFYVGKRLAQFDISVFAKTPQQDQFANVDILSEKAIPAK